MSRPQWSSRLVGQGRGATDRVRPIRALGFEELEGQGGEGDEAIVGPLPENAGGVVFEHGKVGIGGGLIGDESLVGEGLAFVVAQASHEGLAARTFGASPEDPVADLSNCPPTLGGSHATLRQLDDDLVHRLIAVGRPISDHPLEDLLQLRRRIVARLEKRRDGLIAVG